MKKHWYVLSRLAVYALVFCLLIINTLQLSAAEDAASGTCGDSLTWTLKSDGSMTIEGSGAMYNYDDPYYGGTLPPWKDYLDSIKNVTVKDGVTSIGSYAFSSCDNLVKTVISNTVSTIGEGAYELCPVLQAVTLPQSLTELPDGVFSGCESLASIALPQTLVSIGDYAFSLCYSLAGISIPDGVTSIGEYTFSNCLKLVNVSIPDSVESIGPFAFYMCSSLTQIVIPGSVKEIGDYCFWNAGLTEMQIGEGLSYIGRYAFHGCASLKTIYFEGSEETWAGITILTGNDELSQAELIYGHALVVAPSTIILSDAETEVGASYCPVVTFKPTNTTEKTLTWKSADTSIASVDADGTIHGLKVGNTKITATASNGISATMKLQVLFTDVPSSGVYYSTPVYWAVKKGITNGFTDDDGLARQFRPQDECTRAQMVTFLWRLAGKPNPKSSTIKNNKFKDIKSSDYYYKAVLWAFEKGITKGYANDKFTTFRPDEKCLREHAVTFLWRLAGKPSVKNVTNSFKDVKSTDYYYKAVLWAASKNITKGYADDNYKTFRPAVACLREHIVTFLYRYAK